MHVTICHLSVFGRSPLVSTSQSLGFPAAPFGVLAIAITCGALLFTACEDASNVGIGLVDEDQGGQPDVRSIDLAEFQSAPLSRPAGSLPRVLSGLVDDPLIGTIESEGYFDLASTSGSAFRSNEVQTAALHLRPTYTYGDTSAGVVFAIRQIDEDWESSGLPPDTTISTGAVIREFEFTPSDSLVIIDLPESWVMENDEALRSTEFGQDFHGFRLEHVSGNAVVGFAGESHLLAFTESDSAVFPVSRTYSAARRIEDGNIPPERLLYQAASGPITSFEVDMSTDALTNAAINQVSLAFQADTVTLESQKPAGFHRPIIRNLDLYGILDDDRLVLIDRAELDSEGQFVFESTSLADEFQRQLLGTRSYDHFELRLPVGQGSFGDTGVSVVQGSIDVQLFYDTSATENAPTGTLTVTPLD